MFVACAIALLCLVSVSHSAPLGCEDLTRPLDHVDPHHLEGRWAVVAGSLKHEAAADILKERDSVAVDFHTSSYTQSNRVAGVCKHYSRNVSLEGHLLTMKVEAFNFTVTLLNTSCHDCLVFTLGMESPNYSTVDLFLLSRRREVDQREMEEFRAQVECLKMPPPVVMDPTKELCPEQSADKAAAPVEEIAERQMA